jgi:hypothetical protein
MNNGLGYNSSSVMMANPPYTQFEVRAIEKRKTAEEGGTVFYVDTDYVLVTSHGSKDTTEKVVGEWFDYLKEQARQGRFPQQWLDAFKARYAAWKADQEPPVEGTAITNWPAISPAEAKLCKQLGIRAVEDLALANEELIGRLGMGGRSLCARAKDWVTSKDGTAPLIAQLDASRQSQLGLEQQVKDLREAIRALQVQSTQKVILEQHPMEPLEDRLERARVVSEVNEDKAINEAIAEA